MRVVFLNEDNKLRIIDGINFIGIESDYLRFTTGFGVYTNPVFISTSPMTKDFINNFDKTLRRIMMLGFADFSELGCRFQVRTG